MAAAATVDTKNWLKFDGMFFDEWKQKTILRLQKEELWGMASGTERKPAPTAPAVGAAAGDPPGNAQDFKDWENKDSKTLLAL
ncbi:hypothetical protein R1flu_022173 [Riccia fluitans]|uniref:Uncharacterized protein n=1 Tax=Riccia fluitans TaxID=41844 RepID=A0ABD1ZRF5_9MARC